MADNQQIKLEQFDKELLPFLTEVSSEALGGKVLACSDDFFASSNNLIKKTPSASLKGQFGPNGALYDGWESRRHNPNFDWVIILLAPSSTSLTYFDIDTSHFSGNEAPASQVFALSLPEGERGVKLSPDDNRWEEVLPVVELGPNSRHIFKAGKKAQGGQWSAVMVKMIPDGGMARFRAYGEPAPPKLLSSIPPPSVAPVNLLSPLTSARIIACSDANFSPPGNLLLAGRGIDMSDGWETRRSQVGRGKYGKGGAKEGQTRCEWVVAKMSTTGALRWAEVDTAYHPGNYPVSCKIEATLSDSDVPRDNAEWTTIVGQNALGPHRQHWFDVERTVNPTQVFSHVRLTIFPDGGIKRLKVYGYPVAPGTPAAPEAISDVLTIPALPLTPEAFAPYGDVIQGFDLPTSAPKNIHVTTANQGTAAKFHRMAHVTNSYNPADLKRGGTYVAFTHTDPQIEIKDGHVRSVPFLERHPCTSQAFIPFGKGTVEGQAPWKSGGAHLIIVAQSLPDGEPDLSTLRAFMGHQGQGISYKERAWHHSLCTMDGPIGYMLIETQIGDGHPLDVELYRPTAPVCQVQIPPYTAKEPEQAKPAETTAQKVASIIPSLKLSGGKAIVPENITVENFKPFGQIVQSYHDKSLRWEGMDIQAAPHGLTTKYARLADVQHDYPEGSGAVTAISVYRATPKAGLERDQDFGVKVMERHPHTSQAFLPMGKGEWAGKGESALPPGGQMLVITALNGKDDKPDPSSVKAFIVPSSIGINYNKGIWHHPALVLDETLDLACVETQISTGIPQPDPRDCEVVEFAQPMAWVAVPPA